MIIQTESLRTALNILKPIFSGKTTIVATEYVLISGGYISGTDLINNLRVRIESEGDEVICVTYAEILSAAEACRDGEIKLEVIPTGEALMCHFKSGRRRGKFPAMDASEMPNMDFSTPDDTFSLISLDTYQYAKMASEFTMKEDLIRPLFEQVHFVAEDGEVHILGFTGNSMFLAKPHIEEGIPFSVRVSCPKKGISILKEMTGKVFMGVSGNVSYFGADNMTYTTVMADGKIPTIAVVKNILTYDFEYTKDVNLKEFLNDIKDASFFSNKSSRVVILDGDEIRAEDIEYNREIVLNSKLGIPRCAFGATQLLKMPDIDIVANISVTPPEKPLIVSYSNVKMAIMPIMLPTDAVHGA